MSAGPDPRIADVEMLDIAEAVLRHARFTVQRSAAEEFPVLWAEDPDTVLALACTTTAEAILDIEPVLTRSVVELLGSKQADAKRWDVYCIVLASTQAPDLINEALFGLATTSAEVRRILRTAVEPTNAGVRRALLPVMPLHDGGTDSEFEEPLAALAQRLVGDGVDEQVVAEAVQTFRVEFGAPDYTAEDSGRHEGLEPGRDV